MKNKFCKFLTILGFTISISNNVKAQNVTFKTNAFDNYASELVCDINALNQLFTKATGDDVQIHLANNFNIIGTVKSSVQKYDNLKTMIVSLTNFPNTVFSISKFSDTYTAEKYVGRIMGNNYNDLFELVLVGGEYKLQKKQYSNVIMVCPN